MRDVLVCTFHLELVASAVVGAIAAMYLLLGKVRALLLPCFTRSCKKMPYVTVSVSQDLIVFFPSKLSSRK